MALPGHMRHGIAGSTEFIGVGGSTLTLYWEVNQGSPTNGATTLSLYSSDTGVSRKIQNVAGGAAAAEARADVIIAKGRL